MTHRVREVHESDVPALMRLHLDVLDEGRWFISTPSEYTHDPFSLLEHVKEMRRRDNCGWWVVAVNGAPVGFATVTGGHLARITHVARFEVMVARAHRGKGIGHALTSHAVAWARTCPVLHKLSLAVFDDNDRMKPSPYYDRIVDVMEELVKFTLLVRDRSDYLTDRYGDFILLRPRVKPTNYVLWFGPAIVFLGGAGCLWYFLIRRRGRLPESMPAPLSETERNKLERLSGDDLG